MTDVSCEVDWSLPADAYASYFQDVPYTTLLQDYTYGAVMAELNYQTLRHGLISIDGQNAGLVQLLEARLFGKLIHAVILDRGPLWFEGFGDENHHAAFFQAFNIAFPKRLGRKRRIIPESDIRLEKHGYIKNVRVHPYQTYWLDMNEEEDTLKNAMKKNWRNSLHKAQRDCESNAFEIACDIEGRYVPWLLKAQQRHQEEKMYNGADVKTLAPLLEAYAALGKTLICVCKKKDKAVAVACFLIHGRSATYQIGWTSKTGRNMQAQYIVLWESIAHLKQSGVLNLDLGGVNDEDAKGVKTFKAGLGGRHVELSGQYS